MKKFIISGWYGIPNIGAESILSVHLSFLRKFSNKITALSWNPMFTKKLHGVNSISQFSTINVINEIKKCDTFILGGGDIIDDIGKGLIFWTSKPLIASVLKKQVIFSAVGVKYLNYTISKKIMETILKKATLITLRDKYSFFLLKKLCKNNKMYLVADPAFLLPKKYTPFVKEIIKDEFKKKLIVSLSSPFQQNHRWSKFRVFDEKKLLESIPKVLDKIIRIYDLEVIFFPMQISKVGDDTNLYFQIIKRMGNKENVKIITKLFSPEESKAIFGSANIVLSMRFHSSIFSTSNYIPTVAIGYNYSPRIENYYKELGLANFFIRIDELNPEKLFYLLELAWGERKKIKIYLKKKTKSLINRARLNFKLMKYFI
jgi:N-acetylglucosaminyldiphosphoundecaprenol N-acetyl-beta-D-mannosaminyltransferase